MMRASSFLGLFLITNKLKKSSRNAFITELNNQKCAVNIISVPFGLCACQRLEMMLENDRLSNECI
jgi:hypothetical protein